MTDPAINCYGTDPIQLNWEQRDGALVVTPSNQDRFLIKIGKAIEILRQHDRHDQFRHQFQFLIQRLGNWLVRHSERCEKAYLTAGESTLRFIVVRKTERFDSEITDDLADLAYDIANDPDLDLIRLSARALPRTSEEGLQSFLDSDFCIPFHGK